MSEKEETEKKVLKPSFHKRLWLHLVQLLGRKYVAQCGHETYLRDFVKIPEGTLIFKLNFKKGEKLEYCHRCLEEMSIKCAWCGSSITIGDPITLYSPTEEHTMPDYAVKYQPDPKKEPAYVGCLGWNCADTGMDRAGFWVPPGEVVRTPSPLQQMMEQGGDKAMAFNNLSDPEDEGVVIG